MSDLMNTFRPYFPLSSFRASGLIAAFVFLICLFAAESAQAQLTLTVTRTDDRNATCVAGDCSLREAVNAANAAASDDAINFAIPADNTGCTAGVCTITLTLDELSVNSAATAGTVTITNSTGAGNLLISSNNTSRLFSVNPGANLTINGATITKGNGRGTTNSSNNGLGGGIINFGTATLTNSIVSGNMADNGGGIYNNGGDATTTLTNSIVRGNTAYSGGGIINSDGALTLTNSIVSGNMAGSDGGGIYSSFGTTTTLINSTLSGNTANSGGGIINFGTATLTNSIVSGNAASNTGGGIYNEGSGTATLTDSTVSGNTANSSGGIINFHIATLTNSTVSGNTAGIEGGIYNNFGTLNLTSVTVTRNKSTIITCTICAGGIRNTGVANLKNTIIAGNTAANTASSPDLRGAVAATSSFNLIGNGAGTTGISNGDANSNQVGSSANPIDPQLAPLADNGGATQTHALLFGSLALDKGNSFGLASDQRGFVRPVDLANYANATGGDGSDIGAYEAQTAPLASTAATVSISGRVLTTDGRGIINVRLSLTDSSGQTRTAITTSFGYYRFDAVQAGGTYILSAVGKHYTFSQPLQVLNINDETAEVNFIADLEKRIRVF